MCEGVSASGVWMIVVVIGNPPYIWARGQGCTLPISSLAQQQSSFLIGESGSSKVARDVRRLGGSTGVICISISNRNR
jgi:hypothetical protein